MMNTPMPPVTRPGTSQPTILIIENEVSNRILVERVLSTRGYRCISASHGREALQILDHEQVEAAAEQAQELARRLDVLAQDLAADERLADELDVLDLDDRPLGDVEDDAAVAGLIALDQLHAGPHAAFLLIFSDDGLAGDLISNGIERRALPQAGRLLQVILAHVVGAFEDDFSNHARQLAEPEIDDHSLVRERT